MIVVIPYTLLSLLKSSQNYNFVFLYYDYKRESNGVYVFLFSFLKRKKIAAVTTNTFVVAYSTAYASIENRNIVYINIHIIFHIHTYAFIYSKLSRVTLTPCIMCMTQNIVFCATTTQHQQQWHSFYDRNLILNVFLYSVWQLQSFVRSIAWPLIWLR